MVSPHCNNNNNNDAALIRFNLLAINIGISIDQHVFLLFHLTVQHPFSFSLKCLLRDSRQMPLFVTCVTLNDMYKFYIMTLHIMRGPLEYVI